MIISIRINLSLHVIEGKCVGKEYSSVCMQLGGVFQVAEFAKVPLLLIIIIRQMCYDDIFVGMMMMMMMMMMILVIRVFSNSAGKWQCKFVLNCM